MRFLAPILAASLLASCSAGSDDGVVDVVFIGQGQDLFEDGLRLSFGAQHVRAATAEGLVTLDEAGRVAPGIAERWIVTDDGASYIFRLRDSEWPDGEPITARGVRDALRADIRALRGTSLGLDLARVSEIRAMTGRVVEIRLSSPMPDLLQLLAQPELGLRREGRGASPMVATEREDEDGEGAVAGGFLSTLPPEARGLPRSEDWQSEFRPVSVRSLSASKAREAFAAGDVELVLGGRLADLPLADTGALSRGTVRLDPALGLFGLEIASDEGFLADTGNREALALAIDRQQLLEPFNVAGWVPTTRYVAPDLPGDDGEVSERWQGLTIEQRRALALRRVNAWKGQSGTDDVTLSVFLPQGPGSDRLFQSLAANYSTIGVNIRRATNPNSAQLVLKDRTARYGAARWFLNQFHCTLTRGLCSQEADNLVAEANETSDPVQRARMIAAAERQMEAENWYIPFGAPIRWSLVRAGVEGFSENAWGIHPLFPLAGGTI